MRSEGEHGPEERIPGVSIGKVEVPEELPEIDQGNQVGHVAVEVKKLSLRNVQSIATKLSCATPKEDLRVCAQRKKGVRSVNTKV